MTSRQVRDRRAPAVVEAAHAEPELPAIRVITNHNHTYPLTLLYYEAWQPYQATTQQMMAAAAGTLQFTFDTVGNARGMVDAGKVIPLAVTGPRRAISAPDVPTFKELGYDGFEHLFVANGLLAPTGTSPAMIKALNSEIARMNASGPIRDRLVQASYEPGTMSPEDYGAMIDRELKLWGDVVQETGVRIKA